MLMLAAVLALLVGVAAPSPASAADSPFCVPRTTPPEVGLTLVSVERIDARTRMYAFRSKAVGDAMPDGLVRVRVILPPDYARSPGKRYPVMLHLHGTNNSPSTFPANEVEQVLGDNDVIFVEPDGGPAGFYADWYGTPVTGRDLFNGPVPFPPPAWETFHIRELLPWLDKTFRTTGRRAITGTSMGGFGAMAYPARNPGAFVAAASFSGAVDLDTLYPIAPVLISVAWDPCIFGDRTLQADNWKAHNPVDRAAELRGVSLFVASGNGLPGRYDDPVSAITGAPLEILVHQSAENFVAALDRAQVPVTTWFYGNGTHGPRSYVYDDLRRFLPQAMSALNRK
ncbi:putative secreted esterase [Streptomyces scabiei 87.22]|uniref:Putative secreted esterase n=1 Tax=Streptomyces scabiei (strain 87.22) TaxID=680198 RepID=C9YXP5_STRSW|nr:esterase [Streptomyces scabiei]MBP5870396.1 esterase [Streptomyces sp. LBUM 1485]MBP5879134.1 esterase [Streptomyces sp. LBUM 1477]MBP5886822.1 esterase [Streptomyces sp. LBUM 1487]MBP5890444.1 esterase [Streptomyces sp. LBUM 1481]MBP5902819.1 esterase [Streptomyces sp. LBUM 1488]MBP5913587.1 esterase [Streptomyces sp. LBUM 1486]MBP5920570.1 esterase [Streptomyces sp. LBUM 1483]MBP5928119.1 esterase [Streptomyces sp. LBUM 1479]MBP5936274.1 esterase [Streptomyces sp. LBUM 1476]MBZ391577